jgi:serine/threonine protein kinase
MINKSPYLLGKMIGKGGYGSVFAGIHLGFGVPFAVKHVEKRKVTAWDVLDNHRVPRELKLLQQVQKVRRVIRFLDFYEDRDNFVLIMEKPFCCKDLFEVIYEQDALEEELACDYFKQIVSAVTFMETSRQRILLLIFSRIRLSSLILVREVLCSRIFIQNMKVCC